MEDNRINFDLTTTVTSSGFTTTDTTTAATYYINSDVTGWYYGWGYSWPYYVNSGDYKIYEHSDVLVIDVLVAGLEREDIEAFIENSILSVNSTKAAWNGSLTQRFDLNAYRIDMTKPTVKLRNGVLRFEFPLKNEKRVLEIQ